MLINKFDLINWKIFKIIISDRDPNFFEKMWNAIHVILNIQLLYNTAYHFQTNGASKRTNQSTKIILKYYIHQSEKWSKMFFRIQTVFNNSKSASIVKIFNEIVLNFIPNRFLNFLFSATPVDYDIIRIEIRNVLFYAQLNQKFHYDRFHISMSLKIDKWVLIKFYKNYNIFSTAHITKKLIQQYVGLFQIFQKIEKFAYRLIISNKWFIHFVFIIAQLKSCPFPNDNFFQKFRSTTQTQFIWMKIRKIINFEN